MKQLNIGLSARGFYKFKAVNVITKLERDLSDIIAEDHCNLITNSGLDALGSAGLLIAGCVVGTGTGTPVEGQTQLISQVGGTNIVQSNTSGSYPTPPYYAWIRYTFRFGAGIAAGNLREVGVYCSLSGYPLFSVANIVDSGGSPTTLTILSDEYLDVTYELRFYQNTTGSLLNCMLYGTNFTVTARPAGIESSATGDTDRMNSSILGYYSYQTTFYNGAIGQITEFPTGSNYTIPTTSLTPYVQGSYERDWIVALGLNDGNFSGGIQSILIRTFVGDWQIGFSPAIPKDNFKTLVLNITLSWGRYNP